MLSRYLLLSAAALSLSGCGSPDQNAQGAAEKAVKEMLKDPSSARFKEAYVVRQPAPKQGERKLATCGIVDGKNGFGAYTGGSRYVAVQAEGDYGLSTLYAEVEDSDRHATAATMDTGQPTTIFERVYWNPNCVDATHAATHTGEARSY